MWSSRPWPPGSSGGDKYRGNREVVVHGENGLFDPVGRPEEAAERVYSPASFP